MLVAAYVDWCGDEDKEYSEIREFLEKELNWEFDYLPKTRPLDLLQKPADVFVLDYGGIQSGYGDGAWRFFSSEVLRLVQERPNLLILIWSSFTGYGYWEVARQEAPDLVMAPNVIFCDGHEKWGGTSRYDKGWQQEAKSWFSKDKKRRKRSIRDKIIDGVPSSLTGITVQEIASLVGGVKIATIKRHLSSLKKDGLISEMCKGRFSKA